MKSKVIEFVNSTWQNALAVITKDKDNYYKFGETDALPNDIIRDVNSSGTARLCVTRLKQFTFGGGLIDQNAGKEKLNNSQTVNEVISELSLYTAYAPAVIGRVVFSNDGTPRRFYPVAFNKIRKQGSKFVYNENFGTKDFKKGDNIYLDEFEPITEGDTNAQEIIASRIRCGAEQMKRYGQKYGQVVYTFEKGVGRYYDVYPIPGYYSGIEDIQSDAKISTLEHRNVKKGWRTPVIISTGPINDTVKDENGLTDQDKLDRTIESFTGEKAASVMHLQGDTNESKPTVTTIDVAEILDATDRATERIGRKVCRLMTVPPVIVGFAQAGQLGQNQELKNSIDLFRLTVKENQKMISDTLAKVFPEKNWDLQTLKLFDFLPDSILSRLSDAEIREIFELKPLPGATDQGGV